MLVGDSLQETVDLGFVLFSTRQQDVPELMLPSDLQANPLQNNLIGLSKKYPFSFSYFPTLSHKLELKILIVF
ncbi:unnamed protein product [Schistosoma margrebowiei]|uniref:Uncharacterized protein n=1 Tax=Schistosoma margrebowiei TaxID=48269 RepID=A0A183MGX1_9TREM|nr:unnamed protein product [Schistosoma margrebowiei]